MKKIINYLKFKWLYWRLRYHIWDFEMTARMIIEFGSVRELRTLAIEIRRLSEILGEPKILELADRIELNAENLVLNRVW